MGHSMLCPYNKHQIYLGDPSGRLYYYFIYLSSIIKMTIRVVNLLGKH
jgi:hypothetical protein